MLSSQVEGDGGVWKAIRPTAWSGKESRHCRDSNSWVSSKGGNVTVWNTATSVIGDISALAFRVVFKQIASTPFESTVQISGHTEA